MVLKYYGIVLDQKEIKKKAVGKELSDTDDQLFTATLFKELIRGLKSYGIFWEELDFPMQDYRVGLTTILIELKSKRPVIIDSSLYGGHTMVVHGYLPDQGKLLIADPNIESPGIRILTESEFEMIWNSGGNCRALVLTKGK